MHNDDKPATVAASAMISDRSVISEFRFCSVLSADESTCRYLLLAKVHVVRQPGSRSSCAPCCFILVILPAVLLPPAQRCPPMSFRFLLGLLPPSLLSSTAILRSHVRHDQLEAVLQCSHVRILIVPELEALRNDLHRPMGRRSSVTRLEAQIEVAGI